MIGRFFRTIGYCGQFVYHKSISPSNYCYEVIYEAARDLGGLYAKFMQFMGFKLDSIPAEYKVKFMTFYDQTETDIIDVQSLLEKELGQIRMQRITNIAKEPLATGSFGQVYRANLDGNRQVIVKIQKPGLALKLMMDFFVLEIILRLGDVLYPQKLFDLQAFLKEFKKITYAELDYEREAEQAEYFYHHYKQHAVVTVPETFEELCTKRVLVQEYVEGVAISELMRWKAQGHDYKAWVEANYDTDICFLFKEIHFELAWQSFMLDRFFGDPHPGNILVLPKNKFAFIDFGICGFPPANKKNLYNFVKLSGQKIDEIDTEALSQELMEFGSKYLLRCFQVLDCALPVADSLTQMILKNYQQAIESKQERLKQMFGTNITGGFVEMVKAGEKFAVMFPSDLLTTLRNAHLFKSYVVYLEPDFHFAHANLARIMETVPESSLRNMEQFSLDEISVEEAVETVADWVGTIAEADVRLTLKVANSLGKLQYV